MKILNTDVEINITDSSAKEFRDEIIIELTKCVKEPFSLNSSSLMQQVGEQKLLVEIIEYLKYII